MILHYLKVAVRNLMKYKVHSLISGSSDISRDSC